MVQIISLWLLTLSCGTTAVSCLSVAYEYDNIKEWCINNENRTDAKCVCADSSPKIRFLCLVEQASNLVMDIHCIVYGYNDK